MAYTDFTFQMYRGDTKSIEMAAVEADGTTPINLSGWSLWFTGKNNILDADGSAVFQKETGSGIVVTDAASGEATITLAPADTDSLMGTGSATSVDLFCDLQGVDGSGNVATLATGKLTVLAEITRTTS